MSILCPYRDFRYFAAMTESSVSLPPLPLLTTQQLAAALRSRRKALKLTQAEVAARTGLSQNRLSELEKAPEELSVKQLMQLLSVLGLELILQARGAKAPPTPSRPSGEAW
jgi:HTH-type transcriptional regulator/antitoxin HipB